MKKIGKYEVSSILGKGAMGIVYRALDPDINRKVAVKTIRFDLTTDESENEERMQRFMREAQAAGKLTHPNIITIYDVGREKDMTYIVMQYIEGPSLQRLIAAGEKFSTQEVIRLMTQVCSALDYAHQSGIVHRDMKPGNVLLDNNRKPYICDFGVAHVETSTLTQSGTAVGTPSYMSPEQVMGKKIDKRSDIFSLGCILYEFLTGRRPFEAESITTVIYKIINEEPPSLSEVKKGLPAGFEQIIGKALAKDPNDRYQSCTQLANDLRNLDKFSEKTMAITITGEEAVPEIKERKKRRAGPILGISAAVILVIAAAGAFYLYQKTGEVPLLTSLIQKIKGEDSSPLQAKAVIPTPLENKLSSVKESFAKEDYAETIRLAEEILSENPGNIIAKDYLNRAKSRMNEALMAQNAPGESKAGIIDPIESKLNVLKQSYEGKDYSEAVRLAEEVLSEDPLNVVAQDYLSKAKTKIEEAALITQTLSAGITSYKQGDYKKCKQEMEKIFEVDRNHKEARQYWNLADEAIYRSNATQEIKYFIERMRRAEEQKDLPVLLYSIGSSTLKNIKRTDSMFIFNNYDNIRSVVDRSSISIKFKDRNHAEISFSNFSTAVSKKTGQRTKVFEGDIIWTVEKQGKYWKITKEDRKSR